jgi:hypothetical protein
MALVAACGSHGTSGSGPADASVPFDIDNATFDVASAVAFVDPAFSAYEGDAALPTGYGQQLELVVTNLPQVTCANVPAVPLFPLAGAAELRLIVNNPPGVLTTGTYPVAPDEDLSTRASGAEYTVLPTDCSGAGVDVVTTSGTVTLTTVTSTRIAGTYDLTLGPLPLGLDGGPTGSLSGSFDVSPCGDSEGDGGADSLPVCSF